MSTDSYENYNLPYDPALVSELLEELLSMLRSEIPPKDQEEWLYLINEYHSVGERELAYTGICNLIQMEQLPIPESTYQKIKETGEALTVFSPDEWERLKPFVR